MTLYPHKLGATQLVIACSKKFNALRKTKQQNGAATPVTAKMQQAPQTGLGMDDRRDLYSGGFYSLLKRFEKAQKPYIDPQAYLPPVDCDLDALSLQIVTAPDVAPDTQKRATIERKHLEFQTELQGRSELLYVHAMLIANLRRNTPSPDMIKLYQRIWQEKGNWLAKELNTRWRISAATTFADCGVTMDQRALGMGLSVLFDSIKLHESERRLTGIPGDIPFQTDPDITPHAIAFDMQPYSVNLGDLDRNMLARLWGLGEKDSVMFPLARVMLTDIMVDCRTVFARLHRLKVKPDRTLNTQD